MQSQTGEVLNQTEKEWLAKLSEKDKLSITRGRKLNPDEYWEYSILESFHRNRFFVNGNGDLEFGKNGEGGIFHIITRDRLINPEFYLKLTPFEVMTLREVSPQMYQLIAPFLKFPVRKRISLVPDFEIEDYFPELDRLFNNFTSLYFFISLDGCFPGLVNQNNPYPGFKYDHTNLLFWQTSSEDNILFLKVLGKVRELASTKERKVVILSKFIKSND